MKCTKKKVIEYILTFASSTICIPTCENAKERIVMMKTKNNRLQDDESSSSDIFIVRC